MFGSNDKVHITDWEVFGEKFKEELFKTLPLLNGHVVWTFGSGIGGQRVGELAGPHMAEENPFDPDEILIVEQNNCDLLIVNRRSRQVQLIYGERGVAGTGSLLDRPHSAHFIPLGQFKGNILITELMGDHRILIIDRDTGKVLWKFTDLLKPLDAIFWDANHIMVSDIDTGVVKVSLNDGAQVWEYNSLKSPFYLQKLFLKEGASRGNSYGGDLLISSWGPLNVVREIRTSDKATIWEYGSTPAWYGNVYNKLLTSVRGFRYGIGEKKQGDAVTIICEENGRRILCVNYWKELVWELGGASANSISTHPTKSPYSYPSPATPYVLLPTYVTATRRGTLLITDWSRNMIYEVNPFNIPERKQKDAYLFKDYMTTDEYVDSDIMETRGFLYKNIQVFNAGMTGSLEWRVMASHNTLDWQIIYIPKESVTPRESDFTVVTTPWNFIKIQTKSSISGNPCKVDVIITMFRK